MSGFIDSAIAEHLKDVQLDPVTLRRIALALTRVHFSSPDNYGPFAGLYRNFVWSENPRESSMLIDLDSLEDRGREDRLPAIYVGTGQVSFRKMTGDYRVDSTPTGSGTNYLALASCPVLLQCISRHADEALALASLSAGFFAVARDKLKSVISLLAEIDLQSISRVSKVRPKEPDSALRAVFSMIFTYEFQWCTEIESHLIKTISLEGFAQKAGLTEPR